MTRRDKLWWKKRCSVWKNDIFNGKESQQNKDKNLFAHSSSSQATQMKFSFF